MTSINLNDLYKIFFVVILCTHYKHTAITKRAKHRSTSNKQVNNFIYMFLIIITMLCNYYI